MGWLRSKSDAVCHFCQSDLTLVSPDAKGKAREPDGPFGWRNSPNAFLCAVCGSWNTTDSDGRLTSSPPAWVDPRLGYEPAGQTAVRPGSSSSLSSPSHANFAASPFCRTCTSNQALQTHLLASFPIQLPSDIDSPGAQLSSPSSPQPTLEEYQRSLDSRYPLLCADCAPAVEELIKKHDYKAKAWAFGHRLTKSVSGPVVLSAAGALDGAGQAGDGEWRWRVEGIAWRLRGALWAVTHAVGVAGCVSVAINPARFAFLGDEDDSPHWLTHPTVLPLALSSLFWSFWDPTWDRARQARVRGRRLIAHRRREFIMLQGLTYLARSVLVGMMRKWWTVEDEHVLRWAAFAGSVALLAAALISPSIVQLRPPPRVRLVSSRKIERPAEQPPSPSELLSTVSLDASPSANLRSRRKSLQPVFGQASLDPSPPTAPLPAQAEPYFPLVPESMDWEPLETPTKPNAWSIVDRGQLRLAQQRFFGDPKRTGLEDELGGMLVDDRMDEGEGEGSSAAGAKQGGTWWTQWLG